MGPPLFRHGYSRSVDPAGPRTRNLPLESSHFAVRNDFYSGTAILEWRGNLLIGGLSSQSLTRLTVRGDRVIADERIEMAARIRDVAQGPDGAVYLLTDQQDGEILKLFKPPSALNTTGTEEVAGTPATPVN